MRYGPDLVKKFLDILRETPNIRYACTKMGIHHATYYRWRMRHPDFYGEVLFAIGIGREKMNDIAESVILKKVQEGDLGASKYWLGNNNIRYMTKEKSWQHARAEKLEADEALRKHLPENFNIFDDYFMSYYILEGLNGEETTKEIMTPILKLAFPEDGMVDMYFVSYEFWKKSKLDNQETLDEVRDVADRMGIDTTDIQDSSLVKDIEQVIRGEKRRPSNTSNSNSSNRRMFRGRSILK